MPSVCVVDRINKFSKYYPIMPLSPHLRAVENMKTEVDRRTMSLFIKAVETHPQHVSGFHLVLVSTYLGPIISSFSFSPSFSIPNF